MHEGCVDPVLWIVVEFEKLGECCLQEGKKSITLSISLLIRNIIVSSTFAIVFKVANPWAIPPRDSNVIYGQSLTW